MDFKGWWRSGGKRCEPLTVRDEHSRYLLELRAMEDARSETVRESFERLFERHGLPASDPQRQRLALCQCAGALGLEPSLGLVGGSWESIWNGPPWSSSGQWQRMSVCTWTSAENWKQLGNPIKQRWICGGRALITSGRMKLWGCAARANSIALRRENMRARRMIWSIRRCALDE